MVAALTCWADAPLQSIAGFGSPSVNFTRSWLWANPLGIRRLRAMLRYPHRIRLSTGCTEYPLQFPVVDSGRLPAFCGVPGDLPIIISTR
jgi:hypothetical protein